MVTISDSRGLAEGYKSGLEVAVAEQIAAAGLEVSYEACRLSFTPPIKERTYTPDFILPNGIVIETKGRFMTADRQKHKFIMAQHKGIDLRFVFSRVSNRLTKKSRTTYAMWCDNYGFRYAEGLIPTGWLHEPVNQVSLDAIRAASKPVNKRRNT